MGREVKMLNSHRWPYSQEKCERRSGPEVAMLGWGWEVIIGIVGAGGREDSQPLLPGGTGCVPDSK